MAEVLVARVDGIEGFERHVVVKRIRPEQAGDKRFVEMFLDEARLAASLHHHNIVTVHDIGQEDGEYFFAMEYVHGEDLRKLLAHASERDRLVPDEHAITIVSCAAAALHYAHEHRGPDRKPLGIVHRDVSPANILVAYDGNVKVVDFGIAKATHHAEDTQVGMMKGKVAYMSPEQCMGVPVDRRSDIFCLGILLYELVTVRRLFKGDNDYLTMRSITDGVIPKPSEHRPDLAPELEAIIMKALARDPAQRYQTADEMRTALEEYAGRAGLRMSTTALADYMRAEFVEPPMPWLVEDDDCEMELSYDFDGSAHGMVPAPQELQTPVSIDPESPLMRARTKAITGAPDPSGTLALDALQPNLPPPPIASSASLPVHDPRKRWMIAGIAGAAVLLVLVIVALVADSSQDIAASTEPTPTVAPVAPPAPKPVPAPKPAAVAPVAPAPVVEATTVKPTSTPAPAPAAPAIRKKPVAPTKPVKGSWDPDALFPKKK
jgi:eukaryotic-like serine/threonine-protein kinase